tara:strand:- start:12945 stop:13511 length:567 start_codon:yes stop_codon:yes gene_type:complete
VSEVLLQRTRAETVAAIYPKFFATFSSWSQLANATMDDLQDSLRPLGLWRRRANGLLELARVMHQKSGRLPDDRSGIEDLPGVGQYIANAVELISSRSPAPLLDVNMSRVLERYFGPRKMADIRYDPYLQRLAWRVTNIEESISLNWAILDLAAKICSARRPKCKECPLKTGCNYARGISVARDDQAR